MRPYLSLWVLKWSIWSMWQGVIFPTSHFSLAYHLFKWPYVANHGDNYCWPIHENVCIDVTDVLQLAKKMTHNLFWAKSSKTKQEQLFKKCWGKTYSWRKSWIAQLFQGQPKLWPPPLKSWHQYFSEWPWYIVSYLKKITAICI